MLCENSARKIRTMIFIYFDNRIDYYVVYIRPIHLSSFARTIFLSERMDFDRQEVYDVSFFPQCLRNPPRVRMRGVKIFMTVCVYATLCILCVCGNVKKADSTLKQVHVVSVTILHDWLFH